MFWTVLIWFWQQEELENHIAVMRPLPDKEMGKAVEKTVINSANKKNRINCKNNNYE